MGTMTKRRKKKFSVTKAVKAAAREQVGMPPPTRRVEDASKKEREKHRPSLGKLMEEDR
jgi:hypothetical protein